MLPTGWRVRTVVRYAVVLVCGMIAGGRAVGAWQAWRQWQVMRGGDPSAGEAQLTFVWLGAGGALVSLAIALLVWWLLRPGAASNGSRRSSPA